jgi:hypothetical protein
VADTPGALGVAPWAKSGQVAAWSAFIGNESSNNWSGWFDQSGATSQTAGAIVEGTLDLATEFGSVPSQMYVAVARYQTADAGPLTAQFPAGDADANVDADEYYLYDIGGTSVPETPSSSPAFGARLLGNSPNPFNPTTVISFELDASALVRLRVFDVRGREIGVLIEREMATGLHEVPFFARGLASGVYLYSLEVAGERQTRRMVLAK